jgi:Rhodopirellula transposase DDE domain
VKALSELLEDATAGHPVRGTKWTRKTLRTLVKELRRKKFHVGRETVRRLLYQADYALRANRKEGSKRQDADRDRQMRYVARQRRAFLKAKKPVISVDCKKKELIGNFKNPGRTWRQAPRRVLATDFPSDAEGKAIPYGVYEVARNRGFVGVGVSHETAEFAVSVIRRWWQQEGQTAYPQAAELLIQADGGGANAADSWLWKWELQQLADETGLTIVVNHYPTSASKWNWIEHRLFNHISANWAGEPLGRYETVLKFIRTTTTAAGLCCSAYLDRKHYLTGLTLTSEQKQAIRLKKGRVLPKWNYTIRPHAHSGRQTAN